MVEGARLESVFRGNSNVGSNPTLSAMPFTSNYLQLLQSIASLFGAQVIKRIY